MGDISIASLYAIFPELYLALMAMFLLMATAFKYRRISNSMLVSTLIVLAATGGFLWPHLSAPAVVAFNGMFMVSRFTIFSQYLVLAASMLTVIIAAPWLKEDSLLLGREYGKSSEFLVLLLCATLGMLLMVSANDLLTLYLALETSSLALYVLASFERDHATSSEAGLKYFVLGALASGMMLFGMSLVYGFTGTTGFEGLSALFALPGFVLSKAVVVGLILIIVGFCFKLSAVPFHMWTPDVYEGAPTPVTAFFATASKVAAFALFARFLLYPFGHLFGQWQQIVIFVSIASMALGAFAAIMQTNIKRLLAYSSIGHAGYMLMGLAAGNAVGVQGMLIYLATYIFMSAGAFGCVLLMRRDGQYVEQIKDLAGLGQTRPALALAMSIFMFSMAGIPPMSGFFAKFYVILPAISAGLTWLAVLGVIASVIGSYYYIKVVKVMYFDTPAAAFDAETPCWLRAGIVVCVAVTLLFFLMPSPLVEQAKLAAGALVR